MSAEIHRREQAAGHALRERIANPPILIEVEDELKRARTKFPNNDHMYAALVEEVGEVARALLEGTDNLRAECVQVAAMAIRLAEEGDGDYDADPPSLDKSVALGAA